MEIRKIRDASSLSLRKRQVRRSRDGVRRKGGPPAYVQRARASPGTGKNAAHSVRKPADRYVRGSMTGIPDEVVMDLSDREIETFDKLPPAKQKALIRKAKNRAERAYMSHSSDADAPENGSSHAAVSKSRRRMPDTGNYHVHGRNGTDSGVWKIWRREQMVSFFRRPGNSSKAEEMENGPAGTVPIQQTGSREMHPDLGRKSADRGREEGKDPRHAVFLKELRRGIAAAERTSRAREGQKREMKEQWAAEQAERERVKDFLAVSAKSITRRITETAAQVKKAIISGSRLKLLLVLGPVGLLVIMLCLLMSMVSVTSTSQEVTYAAFGEEIVAYAKEWIGVTKYILGAGRNYETDWQDYTDCSGFVHGVYSHFGYEIGGNTNAMEDAAGTVIETNSLDLALPGDIILFYTGKIGHHYSTHVAIYAGDGKMIHCSGGAANVSPETAGRGVCWGRVENDGRQWEVRRVIPEGVIAGTGTGGHRVDPTRYTQRELELIWAVVAQEDNGSYDGALAVISCAMNRTESPNWSYLGSTAMQQLTAYGQFCYSMDDYWRPRLGGNVPTYGGDGYCVETNHTRKVNEGMVTMVTVRRDGSEIGASIPMERIYHEYERSGNDFSVFFPPFASQFCAQAEHVPENILSQASVVTSMDWSQIKDRVYVHAIGATRNKELLKTIPHKQIGDVCAVYRIHITETERDCATVLVTNDMAEKLHVSTEEIHQTAVRNSMEKYPPVCLRMSDMMEELIGSSPEIDGEEIDTPLYVLTNRTKMDGASVIFYPDVADAILRNMPENYYLLPSSVHEWLVVSKNRADKEGLEEMVHAVNETTVDPKDQLSDMVHEYDPVRKIVYAGTVPDPPRKDMGLEERERSL